MCICIDRESAIPLSLTLRDGGMGQLCLKKPHFFETASDAARRGVTRDKKTAAGPRVQPPWYELWAGYQSVAQVQERFAKLLTPLPASLATSAAWLAAP